MEADANVPEIQAANFLAGRRKFRFRIWIEGCRGDVYLYGDGRVRTYGQACRFIDQAADCLHENLGKDLEVGEKFLALVIWSYNFGSRVFIFPFGEALVEENKAFFRRGLRPGDRVEVWVKSIDKNGTVMVAATKPEEWAEP